MIIQEAAEMYLETIAMLQEKNGSVRSIDIAAAMGYSKPTISEQMKKFRENGFIMVDADGMITLTPKGEEIAKRMVERHRMLAKILMSLGVDEETAVHDACKIEHDISEKTFDCLKAHYGRGMSAGEAASGQEP